MDDSENLIADKKGTVRVEINDNLCKGCEICIEFCPLKVFEYSDKLSRKGYYIPVVARESECNGCRFCELLCPDLAIVITKSIDTPEPVN